MTVLFVGVIIFLLILYRNEISMHPASAEFGSFKIAIAITLPVTVALIVLGYVYVTVSNPIAIGTQDGGIRTALFFESDNLSETFTNLSQRGGGLNRPDIGRAQAILRLAIEIEQLRKSDRKLEIERLLRNNDLSLDQLRAEIVGIGG